MMSFDEALSVAEYGPEQVKKLAGPQTREDFELEVKLAQTCWWDYRRMLPVDKTQKFIHVFNDRAAVALAKTPGIWGDKQRRFAIENKLYLKRSELLAPWIETYKLAGVEHVRLSKRWKYWTRARQAADERFMTYEDFVDAVIVCSQKRGWGMIPNPAQLVNAKFLGKADKFDDATIPGYLRFIYPPGTVRFTSEPYYQAAAYAGQRAQREYLTYLAHQILAKYGDTPRAADVWARYQADGRIASVVGLHDALSFINR